MTGGGLPQEYWNAEGFHKFAREVSGVAAKMAEMGLTFGYHNHSFELERFGDRTGLEIMVEQDTCQRDPFESLAISLRNLKAMGAG